MTNKPYTAAQMVERYLYLRDDVKRGLQKQIDDVDEHLKILSLALGTIMFERQETQIKTAFGTAYQTDETRFTMSNRQEFIDFVISNNNYELFTNHIRKEEIEKLADEGITVPGVTYYRGKKVNVRKS